MKNYQQTPKKLKRALEMSKRRVKNSRNGPFQPNVKFQGEHSSKVKLGGVFASVVCRKQLDGGNAGMSDQTYSQYWW